MLRIYDNVEYIIYSSTTFYRDIQLKQGTTFLAKHNYIADGKILAIDPPGLDGKVDRELYKVVLSDPGLEILEFAETGLVGYTLEIRFGFLDENKLPLIDIENTVIIYKGLIEGVSALMSASEFGEVKIEIKGSSPITNLDFKNSVYLNKEERAKSHPEDTCCDELFQGSKSITIRWGRGVNDI